MLWISAVSYLLLSVLVFGLSASVDINAFREKLKRLSGIAIGANYYVFADLGLKHVWGRLTILSLVHVSSGLSCQFFLLPLVAYGTVLAFNLDKVIGVTLLIVASSPGGSYSNLWWAEDCAKYSKLSSSHVGSVIHVGHLKFFFGDRCSLFNADLALSVAMTCASTIVSAVMLPVNLLIYINLAYSVR